jgi:carbohydrate diacid regulator
MLDPHVAQEISSTISAAIGHNVLITDSRGLVIGSGDVARVGSFHEASLSVIATAIEASHDRDAATKLEGVQPGITLPLFLANRVVGTVGITGSPSIVRPFGEIVRAQTQIMLRETMLVRLALLRDQALEELLADVAAFDAESSSQEALVTRGEELGFRLDLPRAAVVVTFRARKVDEVRVGDGDRGIRVQSARMDLLRSARDIFIRSQDVVAGTGPNAIGVLCDIAREDERGRGGRARKLSEQLVAEVQRRHELTARAGIGRVAESLSELRRSYDDAWMALRLGQLLAAQPRVHDVLDHPVGALLLDASPRARERYREAVLGSLAERPNWEELRRTIIAWCESGHSLVDSAAVLRVHRNTLLYRIDRLSKLTGTSLRDSRHAIALYLACLMDDLEKQRRQPELEPVDVRGR